MTAPAMQSAPAPKAPPASMRELLELVCKAYRQRWQRGRMARLSPEDQVGRYFVAVSHLPIPAVQWAARELVERPERYRETRNLPFYPDQDELLAVARKWRDPNAPPPPVRVIGGAPAGGLVDRKRPCLWCAGELDPYGHVVHEVGCLRDRQRREFARARAHRLLSLPTDAKLLTEAQSERLEAEVQRILEEAR